MTKKLSEAYTKAGKDANVLVIPAGIAFDEVKKGNPEISLYSDNRHPSKEGSYLVGCVIYASIFNLSPVGNTFHAKIDSKTAEILQEYAWKSVVNYKLNNN